MRLRAIGLAAGVFACAAAGADDASMRALAERKGCMNCHLEQPAAQGWEKLIPLTPSLSEIAGRYRGNAAAEEMLTAIVLQGTGTARADRHWGSRASIPSMPPNRYEASPAEARELVRWILSKPD